MSSVVVVGSQWGDEGKGKITDFLSRDAEVIARYQGGDNAGHTIVFNGETFKLRLIPSGIFYSDKISVIGNGVVLNPKSLVAELDYLKEKGVPTDNLRISDRAHVILPYHIVLDGLQEKSKKGNKIGTTNKGIGPAYMDKASRVGIRVADLLDKETFEAKLRTNLAEKNRLFEKFFRRRDFPYFPVFEHRRFRAVLRHVVHIVRNDDHGFHKPAVQGVQQGEKFLLALGIQPRHRLVQHEDFRFGYDHPRDGHAAFLPARKVEGGFFFHLFVGKPHRFDRLPHAGGGFLFGEALEVFQSERHVLRHRVGKQLIFGILEHHSHLGAQFFEIALLIEQVEFPHGELFAALIRFDQPVEVLNEGGFSAARVPDDAEKFPFVDGERHVFEGGNGEFGFRRIYVA